MGDEYKNIKISAAGDTEVAFPGDPDELDVRSIDLSDGAGLGQRTVMKFNAEGSLGATRGVYVGENAGNPPIIYVDACKDLTGTVVIEAGSLSVAEGFSAQGHARLHFRLCKFARFHRAEDEGKRLHPGRLRTWRSEP